MLRNLGPSQKRISDLYYLMNPHFVGSKISLHSNNEGEEEPKDEWLCSPISLRELEPKGAEKQGWRWPPSVLPWQVPEKGQEGRCWWHLHENPWTPQRADGRESNGKTEGCELVS